MLGYAYYLGGRRVGRRGPTGVPGPWTDREQTASHPGIHWAPPRYPLLPLPPAQCPPPQHSRTPQGAGWSPEARLCPQARICGRERQVSIFLRARSVGQMKVKARERIRPTEPGVNLAACRSGGTPGFCGPSTLKTGLEPP